MWPLNRTSNRSSALALCLVVAESKQGLFSKDLKIGPGLWARYFVQAPYKGCELLFLGRQGNVFLPSRASIQEFCNCYACAESIQKAPGRIQAAGAGHLKLIPSA